ncbi:Uncharacterised protein (plasmid) [Tsukamurella tyrosinosolvens]|uniref:Uncharacterized protein n=1 Tax=Tsukamurella tyrosinosolvens TaxID=57704 RepID=A0A1H4UH49_TSUTY|nr:hypothetical protein [Tsukamurella tyrosinosolvens]KXO92923.1 hypothetical protein AXK58_13705 [Tsukamurella tyrosinosolvens]SEC67910.1 hypothetical protein SAMN04489793_2897 [Tsukamurella tyrosinosolvens]VEH94215.1 Uncharacterised protein [Tsukamurella tyrosinosolvens]
MTETATYFRSPNPETGSEALTVFFTAPLCDLTEAAQYDLDKLTEDLISDARDQMAAAGLASRPNIAYGRIRILQDIEPDENGVNHIPQVYATVIAYLTDAEPGDSRLDSLLDAPFRGDRTGADIEFTIPTVESEAEIEEEIRQDASRGQKQIAEADAERAQAAEDKARLEKDPFADDDFDNFFD